jgi:uncharacterized phiE125 gp8 family phage protein
MTPFVRPPWQLPIGVSSVLVIAPTEEPLTVAEGKLRSGLFWADGDPRDALMLQFIQAARDKVERDTGFALLTQTRAVALTPTEDGIVGMPWQAMPCQSITAADGTAVAFESYLGRRAVRVSTAATGGSWTVVAGWPTVDALRTEAPGLYHGVALLTAHYATLGRDLASIDAATEIPFGYEEAIAPYRVVWLP